MRSDAVWFSAKPSDSCRRDVVGILFLPMSSPADLQRMRKVQPFLVSSDLADALDAAIASMASPMFPRVTIASAARELLVLGCELIEAELGSTRTVRWTSLHPTRGPRPASKSAIPEAPDASDDAYRQLSPIALPEALINRLHDLVWHVATATRSKVSIATVMREALARGCVERDRIHREAESWVTAQAMLRPDSGFPFATRLAILRSELSASRLSGRPAPLTPRPSKTPKPRAATAAKTAVKSSSAGQSRARTPRRKSTTKRVAGADDGDDGGDGHGHGFGAARGARGRLAASFAPQARAA